MIITDPKLEYELAKAKDGLTRITAQYHRSWEAGAACVALSAIARLEDIIANIELPLQGEQE